MARFAIIDAGRVINHAEADADFAASQGWVPADWSSIGDLWDGENFTPAPPAPPAPPVVPAAVTMRQARLALLGAGLLDDVDAAIASIPDETTRRAAQIEWEFSNEVQRNNSFTALLGAGLGMSSAQIDALFIQAAAL